MKLIMSMRNLVVESFVAQVEDEKDNACYREKNCRQTLGRGEGGKGGLIWNLGRNKNRVGWSDEEAEEEDTLCIK